MFVLDTGWYAKTGEWAVNTKRFDADVKTVRGMLADRGMKLRLWFSPTQSAASARITKDHHDCRCESDGKVWEAHPVWETDGRRRRRTPALGPGEGDRDIGRLGRESGLLRRRMTSYTPSRFRISLRPASDISEHFIGDTPGR